MTEVPEKLPVRYCHGCGQFDDHPRAQEGFLDADGGRLYHYDCLPEGFMEKHGWPEDHPLVAAAKAGTHGHELRTGPGVVKWLEDIAAAHAAERAELAKANPEQTYPDVIAATSSKGV